MIKNKTYDILKWLVMIVLPAMITFYGVLGATLKIPYTQEVLTISSAFVTMLGTIIGVSTVKYNKLSEEEKNEVEND